MNTARPGSIPAFVAAAVLGAAAAPAAPISSFPLPAVRDATFDKAVAAARAGKVAEALPLLAESVKADPDLPPARLLLARILLGDGKIGAGRFWAEQAAAEFPDHPEIAATFGNLALLESRAAEAEAHLTRAMALAESGGHGVLLRRSVRVAGLLGLAAVAEARRDWIAAMDRLDRLLDIDPKNAAARQARARVLVATKRVSEAHAELQAARAEDPASAEPAELALARLLAAAGDAKGEEEWMAKALAMPAADARSELALAVWLLDRGRLDEARKRADTADALDRTRPEAKRLRGVIARLRGDAAEAEFCFTELRRLSPGDFFANDQLAQTLIEQTDGDRRRRAVQLAELNARQAPDNPAALATLGWVYYRLGRANEAAAVLERAASARPMAPETAYFLAHLLADAGRLDDVRVLLKGAVESKGLFVYREPARAWLARLGAKPPG